MNHPNYKYHTIDMKGTSVMLAAEWCYLNDERFVEWDYYFSNGGIKFCFKDVDMFTKFNLIWL